MLYFLTWQLIAGNLDIKGFLACFVKGRVYKNNSKVNKEKTELHTSRS